MKGLASLIVLLILIMVVNTVGILTLPDEYIRTFVILWSSFSGFIGAIYARHWIKALLFKKA
jgi:hypothetical protein